MIEYKKCVLKFGGSVIANPDSIIQVADVIKNISNEYKVMAVVVSAMGKTTNNLDALAHNVAANPDKRELDALLATGEMQSAALMAMRLNAIGVPARSYNAMQTGITTDNNFGNAKIEHTDCMCVNPLYGVPVVAGFQGVTQYGDITTLGREGSDITAVTLTGMLCADFCWFFKDGGGIYDKNPSNPDARLFREISYTKMLELMRENKTHVLHKWSVELARTCRMPLFVSGIDDIHNGTWIKKLVHPKVR
ncbi:MAG: hypothetical protein IKP24_04790 [Alphaproteobacteria bacterium]|nr:hypothetical protein [Alphaproteobacteria bacterium]